MKFIFNWTLLKEFMSYTIYPLRDLKPEQLPEMAKLHLEDHGLLAQLGNSLISRYFEIVLKDNRVVGVIAIDDQTKRLIGYNIASPEPSSLNSQLTNNKLWFIKEIIKVIFTRPSAFIQLVILTINSHIEDEADAVESNEAGLPGGKVEREFREDRGTVVRETAAETEPQEIAGHQGDGFVRSGDGDERDGAGIVGIGAERVFRSVGIAIAISITQPRAGQIDRDVAVVIELDPIVRIAVIAPFVDDDTGERIERQRLRLAGRSAHAIAFGPRAIIVFAVGRAIQ